MHSWQQDIIEAIRAAQIRQVAYVPDAGHTPVIKACEDDPAIEATVLTTEEEGIPLLAGAWLGGQRGLMLMQSSGAGNCINMLSLAVTCAFPLPMLITMRGEWAEFNGWQVPMGQGTRAALEAMGVIVERADRAEDVAEVVAGALELAFNAERPVAVLLGQRLIGRKKW